MTGEVEGERMGGWKARASGGGSVHVKNDRTSLSRRLSSEVGDERQQMQAGVELEGEGEGLRVP